MGVSAVFVDAGTDERRVTVLLDQTECLDVVEATLRDAGYRLESLEPGLDTVWDVAATAPDLVILALGTHGRSAGTTQLMSALTGHPRLRRVPIALCDPSGLAPVQMATAEHGASGIGEPAGKADEMRVLLGRLAVR